MTPSPPSPLPRMLSRLLVLCFALGLGACDNSAASPEPTEPTSSEVFASGRESIEALRRKRWATTLSPVNALVRWHSKTLNWDAMPEGAEKDTLATELRSQLDSEIQPVTQRLLDIAPAADATQSVRQGISALLATLDIPSDVVFPARTRFEQAWLPALHERFKLITQGLQDFLINGKDERYVIGATGLPALAKEGQTLKQKISAIGHVFDRYQRSHRALAAQQGLIQRILEKDPTNSEALQAATKLRERLALSQKQWEKLVPKLLNPKAANAPSSQKNEVEELTKDMQSVLSSANAKLLPIARRLGLLK